MRVRMIALGVLAVVVLGGGLYLFLQVTSDPAPAVAARDDRPHVRDTTTPPPTPEPGSGGSPIFSPAGAGSGKTVPLQPHVEQTGNKTGSGPTVETGGDDDVANPDVDLDLAMDEANKLYDGNDYEAASKQALRVLKKTDLDPKEQVRMLRVVVSSSCMMGDADQANKYFEQLPAKDQGDMVRRCERVEFHFAPTKPKTK